MAGSAREGHKAHKGFKQQKQNTCQFVRHLHLMPVQVFVAQIWPKRNQHRLSGISKRFLIEILPLEVQSEPDKPLVSQTTDNGVLQFGCKPNPESIWER